MTVFLIILALIFSLAGIFISSKVKVETSYENNEFRIKIYLMKIRIFENNKKKPAVKNANATKTNDEKTDILKFIIENKNNLCEDIKDVFKFVKKKIHVNEFYADLSFGLPDAADTGKMTGSLWSVVGFIFPVLDSLLAFDKVPTININPVFNNPCFLFEYKGKYSLRISHILLLGIKILKKYKKYKGGV